LLPGKDMVANVWKKQSSLQFVSTFLDLIYKRTTQNNFTQLFLHQSILCQAAAALEAVAED
jgi:hypothetical protein